MENLFDLIDDLKKDLNDLEDLLEYLEQDPESTDLIKDIKELKELIRDYIIVNALDLEDDTKEF